ncbi:hypothetical protein GGR53DRAFT_521792 [Hypoxylon sp. FL1150]|nr:hypothetical protein GGR53DRAFT_521792 [Hypoxylon sp. FL1150]
MASDRINSATHGYTLTSLSRWSVLDKKLPPVGKINAIHVYDFDNTLFKTPLPNPKLWNNTTLGQLGSPNIFINGGWWHDPKILAATGDGAEQEEKRAWSNWWNEKVVELVHLTMKQEDALCVLLTGRSEDFSQLLKRIITSKGLDFDMVGLKPAVGPNNERFRDTMHFKQTFIRSLLATYTNVDEIRIYEDRSRHVAGFRDFLDEYNKQRVNHGLTPLTAEVVQVAEISTTLDPVVEVAEVQHLINIHNSLLKQQPGNGRKDRLAIRKTVFFTSYMISPADTARLIALLGAVAPEVDDLKYLANTILITAKPCPRAILDKIGGMGSRMKWEVTDVGSFQKNLWAMRVRPVPPNARYHTDNPSPSVVLGLRRGARPADVNKIYHWQPVPADRSFVFETTVGEKVMLRIEHEHQQQDGSYQLDEQSENRPSQTKKRKFDDDRRSRHSGGNFGSGNNNNNNNNNNTGNSNGNRDFHSSSFQGRGGGENQNRGRGNYRGNDRARGNRGGGGRGGRGSNRGGRGGYRSLDDVDTRDNGQGGFGSSTAVSYDDTFPSMSQGGGGGQHQHQHQHQQPQPIIPPPPPQFGQPFPPQQQQGGQWQQQAPPNGGPSQPGRPVVAPGPDLQNFY